MGEIGMRVLNEAIRRHLVFSAALVAVALALPSMISGPYSTVGTSTGDGVDVEISGVLLYEP